MSRPEQSRALRSKARSHLRSHPVITGPDRLESSAQAQARLSRMLLMIFPTATMRNSCPATASSMAKVCPGLAAGTRFPYPTVVIVTKTVVIVTKLKNRSWLSEPVPAGPKNGMLPNSSAAL